MMKKIALLASAALAASVSLTGCSASEPADTYESFSSKLTTAFNKSVELSKSGDFFYTSEVSSQIARNTIYKNGASVSVFDGTSTALSCPIQFDLVNSYSKDASVVPMQAFTKNGKAEEVLKSMKDFADTSTNSAWIVKTDSLYMVTESQGNINIVGIILKNDGSIDYYMGITGADDFNKTVDAVVNNTAKSWNTPNVLVMYSYGDKKDMAISNNLGIDFQWWLDNFNSLTAKDVNKLAKFDADGNLLLTPVMTSEKEVLTVEANDKGEYIFFNTDGSKHLVDGKQLVCTEGK